MTFHFDPRLSRASTIPSSYYNDASVLDEENRNIFRRTWQLVGRVEQVAEGGRFFTTTIAGEPLLIVRGDDGELRALSNVCRHRAGPVAKGEGTRAAFQCGYHGWTYALDGALRTTPEMDGAECFDRNQFALPQFRIESWNGLLFVNLDSGAPPLAEFLGDLASASFAGMASPRARSGASAATGRFTSTTISRATTSPSSTRRSFGKSTIRAIAPKRAGTIRSSMPP